MCQKISAKLQKISHPHNHKYEEADYLQGWIGERDNKNMVMYKIYSRNYY